MPKAKDCLKTLRDKMRRTVLGNEIIDSIKLCEVYQSVANKARKRVADLQHQHPTQEMLDAHTFFNANKERIEKIKGLLADDESRECLQKMIDFRCTYNTNRFPRADQKSQYFWHDFINYSDKEVLIDCGAFTGDSTKSFLRACRHYGGHWKSVVAFEPESQNYNILNKRMEKIGRGG